MSLRLRHLLLKFLLLAVCFHAALGMALHEARHLEPLAQAAALAPETREPGGPAEGEADHDPLCTWCSAFAAQIASSGDTPGLPAAPLADTAAAAGSSAAFVPKPLRWVFAARDPPGSPS